MKDAGDGSFTTPKELGRRLLRALGFAEGGSMDAARMAGTTGAPLLDADYLARLRAQLGDAVLEDLARDAAIEIADRVEEIARMAEAEDREGVARISHDLIAIAGHLGLSALSRATAELNRGARDPAGPPLGAVVARVRALGGPSREALRTHIQSPESA